MFDELDKMKKKAKSLAAKDDDSEGSVNGLINQVKVDEIMGDAKTTMKEGVVTASDSMKRTAGKVKGTFTPPKTETTKGFMKDVTHFFCSDCEAKLGPMETKKWKNALKALLGGGAAVAGVVLVNPFLMFKGATSLGSLKKDDSGMIQKLKADSKLKEDAREYLVQCEYCGEWLCSKCYLAERMICNRCGRERGFLDDLFEEPESEQD